MNCTICNNLVGINGIRLGVCWDCMEAESIIKDGVDMYDKHITDKTSMSKLKTLISKGWKKNENQ